MKKPTLPAIPKLKIKTRKQRTHVPPLHDNDLKEALDNLAALPISSASKRALADILQAAANPNNERVDVVISTLDKPRQKMINKTAKQVGAITDSVIARGRAALEAMSDEEWQRLLDSE